MKKPRNRPATSATHRFITGALGALFVVVAVVIGVISELTMGVILAALVIGGLGLDALVNAWRNRPSLLEKIGPLP